MSSQICWDLVCAAATHGTLIARDTKNSAEYKRLFLRNAEGW